MKNALSLRVLDKYGIYTSLGKDILDEMSINGINTYALIDITDVDKGFIAATEAANTSVN